MNSKYHIAKRKYIFDVIKSIFFSIFLLVFSSSLLFDTEEEAITSLSEKQLMILILIFLLSLLIQLILYWIIMRRFLFSDNEDSFLIEKGLIIKRKTDIPYKNIHTISIKRRFFDLILGLSTLQIDTGTTASFMPEANVVVDKKYAPLLKAFIEDKRKKKDASLPSPYLNHDPMSNHDTYLYQLTWKKLMMMGLLKPGFLVSTLVLTSIFLGTSMFFLSFDLEHKMNQVFLIMLGINVISILFVGLVFMLFHLIKYFRYRLSIDGDDITYQYGLFNKVEFKLSKKRINAVHINQSILYRTFSYYELSVSVLGIGDQNNNDQIKVESKSLLPMAKKEMLETIIDFIGFNFDQQQSYIKPKQFSRLNYIILPIIPLILFSVIPYFFIALDLTRMISPILVHILLVILSIIGLVYRLKHHGFTYNKDIIRFQRGPFTIRKTMIKKSKVQVISYKQNPLLLIEGIGHICLKYKDLRGKITMRSYPKDDFTQLKHDLI